MDFELEIQKTNVGIRINIFEILCVPIVRHNRHFWLFRSKLAQKRILGLEFQNYKPGFGISTSNIPWVLIFRQNGQFWIFGLNLGKLPNYVRYFGYYNVEGVAESWVEVKMSWVEVDGAAWSWVHDLVIPFHFALFRSSRSQISSKLAFFKITAIFTKKHLRWNLFFKKLLIWRATTWLGRDSNLCISLWVSRNF